MFLRNKVSHQKFLKNFFSGIIFITDCRRVSDYIDVAKKLSNYSIIILRDYHLPEVERLKMGLKLREICKQKGHLFLVARDFRLAIKLKADGIHLPEKLAPQIIAKLGNHKNTFFISLATHTSPKNIKLRHIPDIFLLSQIFPSISHVNTTNIPYYHLITKSFTFSNVAALGGVNITNYKRLSGASFTGWAMISGVHDFI